MVYWKLAGNIPATHTWAPSLATFTFGNRFGTQPDLDGKSVLQRQMLSGLCCGCARVHLHGQRRLTGHAVLESMARGPSDLQSHKQRSFRSFAPEVIEFGTHLAVAARLSVAQKRSLAGVGQWRALRVVRVPRFWGGSGSILRGASSSSFRVVRPRFRVLPLLDNNCDFNYKVTTLH